jgi:hypothetical protein
MVTTPVAVPRDCQCLPSRQMLASRRLAPMKDPKDAAKRIVAR